MREPASGNDFAELVAVPHFFRFGSTLCSSAVTLCQETIESMRTGKPGVHQKTLNRLLWFIDEFKQLNFIGDQH